MRIMNGNNNLNFEADELSNMKPPIWIFSAFFKNFIATTFSKYCICHNKKYCIHIIKDFLCYAYLIIVINTLHQSLFFYLKTA